MQEIPELYGRDVLPARGLGHALGGRDVGVVVEREDAHVGELEELAYVPLEAPRDVLVPGLGLAWRSLPIWGIYARLEPGRDMQEMIWMHAVVHAAEDEEDVRCVNLWVDGLLYNLASAYEWCREPARNPIRKPNQD